VNSGQRIHPAEAGAGAAAAVCRSLDSAGDVRRESDVPLIAVGIH